MTAPKQLADGRMAPGQKCVPPRVKARQPLEPAKPLSAAERYAYYTGGWSLPVDPARLTGPQRRRIEHKLSHAARGGRSRPVEAKPLARTPAGTPQPRSHTAPRGFLKSIGAMPRRQRERAFALWLLRRSRS